MSQLYQPPRISKMILDDHSENGYKIRVYEEDGDWSGTAHHANGREVFHSHKPTTLNDLLGAIETAVIADRLREANDELGGKTDG